MGKPIKVAFVDFEPGFVPEKSLLYRTLLQRYSVELSKEPDYVFYSNYGERHLKYNGIRIFYTRENIAPDFNDCDYAIGFDYLDRHLVLFGGTAVDGHAGRTAAAGGDGQGEVLLGV